MDAVERAVTTVVGDVLSLSADLSEHLRDADEIVALTARVRAHLESLPRAAGQRTAGHYKDVRDLLDLLEARLALLPMVRAYTAAKRDHGVMDYGDQVAVAARIAGAHPEVGEIERGRFGAVLLDEYQDTGEAQRVLLTSLFAGHPVTAVGDPRQSIYGWRGASAGNLERFGADFAGAQAAGSSRLTVSFRNGAAILGAANLVADGIPVRGDDGDQHLRPGPGREAAGRVVVALHPTVVDEADWVAEQVAGLDRGEAGVDWGKVAVLARKRSHFPRLESALRDRGVPCEVVGLGGLLHEPEVVDVVSTLRVLADPTAGAALRAAAGRAAVASRSARPRCAGPASSAAGGPARSVGCHRRRRRGRRGRRGRRRHPGAGVRRRRRAKPGRRSRRPGRPRGLLGRGSAAAAAAA